jgi:hypothetical protein
MTGRNGPRRCERRGALLGVAEEGLFRGEGGVAMPWTTRLLPPPSVAPPASDAN